jgi:hypothetical protein
VNNPNESGAIGSIDIPSPKFFWMLRPWKNGTLATMDGKARFAELSFVGKSRIKITPLIDFPRQGIDRELLTALGADICVTQSGGAFHIADIAAKKTKTFFAGLSWRWSESTPIVLDTEKGLIIFPYYSREYDNITYKAYYNIIYDPKKDEIIYKSPEGGEPITLNCSFTPELVLSHNRFDKSTRETVLYNWKTQEITRNELTRKLDALKTTTIIRPYRNINLKERYLFADISIPGETYNKKIKINWDENYEDVKVIPLDYLVPEGKWFDEFYFSSDGKWATNFVGGYRRYGELLDKRIFFHMDSRYPNGISMPIFVDGYYERPWDWGSFVEHPEYGLCYAEEKYREENGKRKLYLRLYKMSDVLAEINRRM